MWLVHYTRGEAKGAGHTIAEQHQLHPWYFHRQLLYLLFIFPQEKDLWRCFKCSSTCLERFLWKMLSRGHWWWLQLLSKCHPGTTCSWDLLPILPQFCKERMMAFGTFLMKFLGRLSIILTHQARRLGAIKSPRKSCWYLPRCFKLYHKIK